MPTSVGTVFVDVRFNVGDAARQLQAQLAAALPGTRTTFGAPALERTWTRALSNIGAAAAQTGKQLTIGLTLPLTLVGKAATQAYAEFDTAMTQISAINQVPIDTTNEWRSEVRALGNDYGIAAEEAAAGLYFITSSGVAAGDAIEVLNVAMKASAVGLGETKVIADVLTSALSAYQKQGLTAAQAADQLTAAVRLGKGEADQLAGSLSQVIPIAANLGVSFGEVTGALSAMTLSGTSSDQAATQLRGLFNTLQDMPPIAQRALKQYTGLDYAATRLALKNEGLIPTLKAIYDGFDGQTEAMAEVFGNIRALTGVFNLFGNNTEQTLKIVNETMKASGDLSKAWAVTAESDAKKLDKAMNTVHDSLVGLGAQVIPVATAGANAVGTLGSAFGTLPEPIQNTAVALGTMAAATGPLMFIGGKTAKAIGDLGTKMREMSPAIDRGVVSLGLASERMNTAIQNSTKLTKTFGSLNKAMFSLGGIVAAGAVGWALYQDAMNKAEASAADAANWSAKGASGSVEAGRKQVAENKKNLDSIKKDMDEWQRQNASLNPLENAKALLNVDALNQRSEDAKALLAENERILKIDRLSNEMANKMGNSAYADAFYVWLEAQGKAGHVYETSEAALLEYNKALAANDGEANKVAESTLKASNSIGGLIAKAKAASEGFFGLMEAEDAVQSAEEGLVDAHEAVGEAEEKYRQAKLKTLDADRKILDAQRKATESSENLKQARLDLADAERKLADARSGPSEDEKLNLESAKIAVQEARKRLSGDFDDPLDRRKARIDYRRAQLDLERTKGEHGERVAGAEKDVVDARKGVADAIQAEVDANQAVVEAREARTQASKDEAQAQRDIAAAQEGVRDAEYQVGQAKLDHASKQDALNTAINGGTIQAESFYKMLDEMIKLDPTLTPILENWRTRFKAIFDANAPAPKAPEAPQAPPAPAPAPAPKNAPSQMPGMDVTNPFRWKFSAYGNPLSTGQLSTVNERGMPELWSAGGKQFLLPTTNGQVTPLKPMDLPASAKGGDGVTIGGDIIVQGASQPVATAYEVRRQLRQQTPVGSSHLMAYAIVFDHHVEIDGVPLSTPAWEHLNIQSLYSAASRRGDNRVMPGASGRRGLPWRADETMRTITMIVTGDKHWDGTPNADPSAGLWANLAHLTVNVASTPATGDGSRQAVIKRNGAPDLVASVQVRGFEIDDESYSPAAVGLTIDIALLQGAFL